MSNKSTQAVGILRLILEQKVIIKIFLIVFGRGVSPSQIRLIFLQLLETVLKLLLPKASGFPLRGRFSEATPTSNRSLVITTAKYIY